jgi:hypothetical protein
MNQVSKETASQIAVEHLKRQKYTEKIYVATVEGNGDCWIVQGTCPIDLLGKPWAEKFEVIIDAKGKVKSTNCALL